MNTGQLIRLPGTQGEALGQLCRAADKYKADEITAARFVVIAGTIIGLAEPGARVIDPERNV